MKNKHNLLKSIIIVLLSSVLYSIPIVCIYFISNREISEYDIDSDYDFKEKAYGSIDSPVRQSIRENYIVSGEVTSEDYRIVRLPECDRANIIMNVNEGDEVRCGEIVGTSGNVNLYSSATGIVENINLEQLSMKVRTFDKLILRIKVDKEVSSKIKGKLFDKDGNEYEVTDKSNQYVDNGMTVDLKIKSDKYKYGEKVNDLCLFTGKEYEDVIVIKKDCVYQKPGSEDYYVRLCDNEGYYKNEQKVTVGFESNGYVSVTGITEADRCDSGYKYVINNEEVPQSNVEMESESNNLN